MQIATLTPGTSTSKTTMKKTHLLILGIVVLLGIASVLKGVGHGRMLEESLGGENNGTTMVRNLGFGQDKLRFAVFGGANAWGVGLESRFKAYPYLLSPTVDNFAHTSMGPNYYSVCTETVVGDDAMYDVVIFDYWLRYFEGLDELARRIRQRYPRAILIFVRNWEPVHFRRKDNDRGKGNSQTLAQWKHVNDLDDADLQTIIKALENDTGYWYLPSRDKADASIWQTAQSVDGYMFTFTQRESGKQTLVDFLGYFEEKRHSHISELGHEAVADGIKFIIKSHTKDGDAVELVSGINGDWGRGDWCNLWYFTGGTKMMYGGADMQQFDEKNGHFALEVSESAWLTVSNKFENDGLVSRTLYVNYLTSEEAGYYPNAKISIGSESWILHTLNTIDPHHDIRTVPLGQIPDGSSNVTISTLGNALNPFRLVGITFGDETSKPDEWAFGPTKG